MSDLITDNAQRWLNAISSAEGTRRPDGSRGYNIMYGGGTFQGFDRHPDTVIKGGPGSPNSAAAGAYQFMPKTYSSAAKALNLTDFGPASQDQAALQLIRWRGVDPDVDQPTPANIAKLAGEWASFPMLNGNSQYNQPVKSAAEIQKAFGGDVTGVSTVQTQSPVEPDYSDFKQFAGQGGGDTEDIPPTGRTGQKQPTSGPTQSKPTLSADELLEQSLGMGLLVERIKESQKDLETNIAALGKRQDPVEVPSFEDDQQPVVVNNELINERAILLLAKALKGDEKKAYSSDPGSVMAAAIEQSKSAFGAGSSSVI